MSTLPTNSTPLRVLFLNPPGPGGEIWMKEVGRCGRKAIGGEVWPQTGLAYLAAMVRREGHEARVTDAMAEGITLDALVEACRDWHPALIIVNSATPTLRYDALVLQRLREETGALCGFCGPHVSALPEETLRETGADFGLVNEAEETVAELTRRLAEMAPQLSSRGADAPERWRRDLFSGIPGLVWRGSAAPEAKAEIVSNTSRSMIPDLDALPLPARDLLPNHLYRVPFFGDHPFATIIPSRGCPWPCSFCRAGRVWGRRIRLRSVESVLSEIEDMRTRLGIRHLAFMTDSLTLNRKWALDLFRELAALPEPPEWMCNSRVDVVDAELLHAMKQANCRIVSYGLESGSQAILDRCKKGITTEQSETAIRLTREAGILSMAYFIIGLPGETRETVRESIRFAKRIAPDYVNFHVATPFPGTDLYEEAQEKGWLTSTNWDDYEEEGSAVLQVGELTPEELQRLQSQAMRSFYLRPSRLWRELRSLGSWAELKAKARAGMRVLGTLKHRKGNA
jgi:anaerobic magnesium-protoporphyrin IX monomethyl ester cyclase